MISIWNKMDYLLMTSLFNLIDPQGRRQLDGMQILHTLSALWAEMRKHEYKLSWSVLPRVI